MFKTSKIKKISLFLKRIPTSYSELDVLTYINRNFPTWKRKNEICKISKLIILNLIHRKYEKDEDKKCLYLSKDGHSYVYGAVHGFSFMATMHALDILKKLNIIHEITGCTYTGKITRLKLIPVNKWKVKDLGISLQKLGEICFYNDNYSKKPSIFREKVKKKVISEKVIPSDHKISKQVNKINSYLLESNFEEFKNCQYHRVFGKDEKSYGRFYSAFQRIPKDIRKEFYKKYDLVELDYQNMNPNILFTRNTGGPYKEGDFYNDYLERIALPLEYRPLAKKIFMIVLGTKSRLSAEKALTRYLAKEVGLYENKINKFTKESRLLYSSSYNDMSKTSRSKFYYWKLKNNIDKDVDPYLMNSKFLLDEFELELHEISEYFYKNNHTFVQNIESKIIAELMEQMIKDRIAPLSIHDCIVVPKAFEKRYEKILDDTFRKVMHNYVKKEVKERLSNYF